jgi:hypothetical protein
MNQEYLKKRLKYYPETGIFTWIRCNLSSSVGVKCIDGKVAGTIKDDGYIMITIDKKRYRAHRLAFLYMTGKFPEGQVDHINHRRNDNRYENLRDVTHIENCKNKATGKRNKSGMGGVWKGRSGKWLVYAVSNNKRYYLGCYSDFNDACAARVKFNMGNDFHESHGRPIMGK